MLVFLPFIIQTIVLGEKGKIDLRNQIRNFSLNNFSPDVTDTRSKIEVTYYIISNFLKERKNQKLNRVKKQFNH